MERLRRQASAILLLIISYIYLLASRYCLECGAGGALQVTSLDIVPSPVVIGQPAWLSSLAFAVNRNISGPVQGKVVLKKRTGPLLTPLPCVQLSDTDLRVGSCSYADLCAPAGKPLCDLLIEPALQQPCLCPLAARLYELPPVSATIPPVLPSWLTSGDYEGTITGTTAGGGSVLCLSFTISVRAPTLKAMPMNMNALAGTQ